MLPGYPGDKGDKGRQGLTGPLVKSVNPALRASTISSRGSKVTRVT